MITKLLAFIIPTATIWLTALYVVYPMLDITQPSQLILFGAVIAILADAVYLFVVKALDRRINK